jgi:hypothetical protein
MLRLWILQSRDECRCSHSVHVERRDGKSTTCLSKSIHAPTVVGRIEINGCEHALVESLSNGGRKKQFARFAPKCGFESMRQYANELLLYCAPAFTATMDNRAPNSSCSCAGIDSAMMTVPMVLAGD